MLDLATTLGEEVDFVIETGGRLLRIEVKATTRPRLADATPLRRFRAEYGKKARAGLLLHTGQALSSGSPPTSWPPRGSAWCDAGAPERPCCKSTGLTPAAHRDVTWPSVWADVAA